jgi:SAM-dependent methyltransferase
MRPVTQQPLLYRDLAPWFHLLTAPEDYIVDAQHALQVLTDRIGEPPRTILEMGSGGGNTASHLKAHAELTLADVSAPMLEQSLSLNPECEHLQGDMRTMRLRRTFDAVFVHDAVSYLTTEDDLRAAFVTAWEHLRPGGAAMFEPDHIRETYADATDHGGHDGGPGDPRALRYLLWRSDPDPTDTWYVDEMAYLLRDGDGGLRVARDTHYLGLFPRATWVSLLGDGGFVGVRSVASPYEDEAVGTEGFIGTKP